MDIKNTLLIGWNTNGGANEIVRLIRKGLDRRGIRSDVVTHNINSPLVFQTYEDNVKHYSSWGQFAQYENLKEYDIIHSHTTSLTESDLDYLSNGSDAPLVYTAHSVLVHETLMHSANKKYKQWFDSQPEQAKRSHIGNVLKTMKPALMQESILSRASRVIHPTHYGLQELLYYYPEYAKKKSVVIPHGSDFYEYVDNPETSDIESEIRAKLGDKSETITYSGRLIPEKGVFDLVKAFNNIKKSHPNAVLHLLGDGDTVGVHQAVLPRYRDSIFFEGWIKDKKRLAACHRAGKSLVNPTHHESFCLSALDAMHAGEPVVISDIEGPHEWAVDKLLAYGIRPKHPQDIVNRVNWIFNNPTKVKINASMVKEIVRKRHGLENMVNMLVSLYDDLLAQDLQKQK